VPKVVKFFLLLIVLAPLVFFIAKRNHEAIEIFAVEGVVADIKWNSSDHGMPIISIREGNQVKLFKSNRITLKEQDLSVGDSFVKLSGSKDCKINNELKKCIN
jgi:hypothetical protein